MNAIINKIIYKCQQSTFCPHWPASHALPSVVVSYSSFQRRYEEVSHQQYYPVSLVELQLHPAPSQHSGGYQSASAHCGYAYCCQCEPIKIWEIVLSIIINIPCLIFLYILTLFHTIVPECNGQPKVTLAQQLFYVPLLFYG